MNACSSIALACILCLSVAARSGALQPFELTPEWEAKIRQLAPDSAPATPGTERKLLVFSLCTGFKHWCIPQTEAVVDILGERSGAYKTVRSKDIEQFQPENIGQYDAIVLNNNCPAKPDRDLFRDVLVNKVDEFGGPYKDVPLEEREALAAKLFHSLTAYVAQGGGLILLHGAIANFNNSDEFSEMVGGSFHFHPAQQDVVLNPVDPAHPLLEAFDSKPFVHYDEPYFFNRAYSKLNFHPLLEMDVSTIGDRRVAKLEDLPRYVAWVKRHEQGRVFYCSPSHNAQSFENPVLLHFLLSGFQYALGDLECPDLPTR